MSWKYVQIERNDRVAIVRFDRGDGLNPLSIEAIGELTEAARSFGDDLETTAIVVTGTKRCFSAGRDLRDPAMNARAEMPMLERRHSTAAGPKLCQAWEDLEQLTIAAIEGFAIGGGMALALACDMRVMGSSAHLRAPEVALGLSMSWGTIPRLVNLVGPARAKQALILAEDRIPAASAREWGLAEEVVPDGETASRALEIARKAAAMPPLTVRLTKEAVNAYANALARASIHMDTDQVVLTGITEDHREAVAAFRERRQPKFTGG